MTTAAEEGQSRPRDPFWGYGDLFLFIAVALGCVVLMSLVVAVLHPSRQFKVPVLLAAQFCLYAFLLWFLRRLFHVEYGRPLWPSLGWVSYARSPASAVLAGVLVAFGVGFASTLLKTPDIDTPLKELLADRKAVIMVAVFGTTLGPIFEELVFRGFMQPLFVRSLGTAAGIFLAALMFGLLHLQEYAFSWRHGLLITLAGAAFGWMRHRTGSTRYSTIMHAAYNGTFFIALVAQRKDLPHIW